MLDSLRWRDGCDKPKDLPLALSTRLTPITPRRRPEHLFLPFLLASRACWSVGTVEEFPAFILERGVNSRPKKARASIFAFLTLPRGLVGPWA